MNRLMQTVAAISVVALIAGCGSTGAAEANKAGGAEAPVVLRIGTNDRPGYPAADQIEEFARLVAEISQGSMRIEPVWGVGSGPDWDQQVARKVVAGEIDMGLIPSRAWDTEGVTTLRALNAPFLITSDEALAAVVSSDLADDLLAGLDDIGLAGLALFPEGLRHPFGFDGPLLGPHSYTGATIRTPTSVTTEAMFEALGATTTDDDVDVQAQDGMESSFLQAVSGTATGNVVFYPKVNSLVVNADAFSELSDHQRSVLAEAAERTRDWTIETFPTDAEAAAKYCESGWVVVAASADDLAALEDATLPVYAELENDPETARLIEAIRGLTPAQSVSLPTTTCGEADETDASAGPESTESDDIGAINGIYRWELTAEELRAGGVPEDQVPPNAGFWTNTFDDGQWSDQEGFMGTYTIDGDLLKIRFKDGVNGVYRWRQDANGDLHVEVVEASEGWAEFDAVWTSKPWTKIGDIEGDDGIGIEFPEGSFRADVTAETLTAAGASQVDATNHAGLWTLTFEDGDLTVVDVNAGSGKASEGEGVYCVEGDRVLLGLIETPPRCGDFWSARWTLDGDELRFVDIEAVPFIQALFGSEAFIRVG